MSSQTDLSKNVARTTTTTPPSDRTTTSWLMVIIAVVVFSGGLFGYDQGVISGALHGIQADFSIGGLLTEVVTSCVTLGALFGALAGGELADRLGRRQTVLIAGTLFTLGSLVEGFAPDSMVLVIGRLVIGAGVGVAAVAAPLYAAELAPAALRGRFVSAYQMAITIGIFLAYVIDGWLSKSDAWRWMLGVSAVPGLMLLIVAWRAPESPRWLVTMHRRPEAAAQLRQLQPEADTEAHLDTIETALAREAGRASWKDVFRLEWRRPLLIGVGLSVFQQITGINAIIYYANQIFESAGFITKSSQTMATTWAIGGVNVLATLIALAFIDRLGRRKLLLAGLLGMGISLSVVGIAFRFIGSASAAAVSTAPNTAGIVMLLALVTFISCFAFSMGPVVWTVINEIFPGQIRARAVAVATAVNWGSAYLVSQTFLSLVGLIGSSFTFWLYALFCGIGWFWIYHAVPETKGRTLEQIQQIWEKETAT